MIDKIDFKYKKLNPQMKHELVELLILTDQEIDRKLNITEVDESSPVYDAINSIATKKLDTGYINFTEIEEFIHEKLDALQETREPKKTVFGPIDLGEFHIAQSFSYKLNEIVPLEYIDARLKDKFLNDFYHTGMKPT